MSQLYRRSELLRKAHAASRRKGVVGKTGNKIPSAPKATERTPRAFNK